MSREHFRHDADARRAHRLATKIGTKAAVKMCPRCCRRQFPRKFVADTGGYAMGDVIGYACRWCGHEWTRNNPA